MKLSDFTLTEDLLPESPPAAARSPYPRDTTVPGIFAARAAAAPEAVAIVWGEVRLSYGLLAERTDRLAARLCAEGLAPGSVVAIMLDRSPAMVVAMLAVLKAGAAYLPIDAALPVDRIRYMLAETEAPFLIAAPRQAAQVREFRAACPALRRTLTLDPDGCERDTEVRPSPPPVDRGAPDGLAYVMYTSGTSGRPKGVMVEHRAILRLVLATNYIDLGPADCILQTGTFSFDAATFEVWGALLNGARLCLPPTDDWLGTRAFAALVGAHGVTTAWLTAGVFHAFAAEEPTAFAGLKTLVSGGERLSPHHVNLVRRANPRLTLVNGYGPTENTTFTTTFEIRDIVKGEVPIGRPIANTTVLILDDRLAPVPAGETGELCTGGDGLARGYLNDPDLTRERFIAHPFDPGERLYRTGDLARWRPDGEIEFLGRRDAQVKIRGFRIEPAEIEACLLTHETVRQAVVVPRTGPGGDPCLVAYYTARADVPDAALREHAHRALPDYMVPASFVPLPALPITPNGKVDRSALPEPEADTFGRRGAAPDRRLTATEAALCAIWREVLGRPDIGAHDNFFDLGGHSLGAVRLVHLIQQHFDVLLPFTTLFRAPSVAALAQEVLDAVRFGDRRIDQPLVTMNTGSPDSPVFAFPPGTADALGYAGLAGLLASHLFHAFNFIEAETRIQDQADLIARAEPDGPSLLFGYSGGGNFAFRTARELERRGRRVGAVVMLDASRFVDRFDFPDDEVQRLALDFVGAEGVQPYLTSPALKDKVVRAIERYHAALASTPDDGTIDAPIHLIVCEGSQDAFHDPGGRLVCSKSAWAGATRGTFRTYQGSGDHRHMLTHPHLEANAVLVADILRRAGSGQGAAERDRPGDCR